MRQRDCGPAGAAAKRGRSSSDSVPATAAKPEAPAKKLKIGSIEVSGNWRVRAEGWNWFQGSTGENDYPLLHSLLRIGIGQQSERFDWKLEAAQDAMLALRKRRSHRAHKASWDCAGRTSCPMEIAATTRMGS